MKNTKYTLGKGHFSTDSFPSELHDFNGIIPLAVVSDLQVGEEIALFWMDRTPFVHELAALRPFRFFLKSGLFNSEFGPLMWMLFTVPFPDDETKAFASVEYHLNPFNQHQIELWRKIGNQTHWHMSLLGTENAVVDVFEFENTYGISNTLDQLTEMCDGIDTIDFMRVKREFWGTHSLDDLHSMA